MATYLDASAIVKMVVDEPGAHELRQHLATGDLVCSQVGYVESLRAIRRSVGTDRDQATEEQLSRIFWLSVDPLVVRIAAELPPVALRSFDAIHLATARRLGPQLTSFVSYDRRLAAAAAAEGLPVSSVATGPPATS